MHNKYIIYLKKCDIIIIVGTYLNYFQYLVVTVVAIRQKHDSFDTYDEYLKANIDINRVSAVFIEDADLSRISKRKCVSHLCQSVPRHKINLVTNLLLTGEYLGVHVAPFGKKTSKQ